VRLLADLTKFGIVIFVLLAALAGYATGYLVEKPFSLEHLGILLLGVYFLSSGSLALNQAQEYKIDRLMKRTLNRPIAAGKITPAAGFIIAFAFIFAGLQLLNMASSLAGWMGMITVVLYNGVYTPLWKKKWVFGAVPGAIPGAMPVLIGYTANTDTIFTSEAIYLFLIMFLWQMPHFWCIAIKFKDDYAKAGIPTLPVALGMKKTLFQIGLYTFVYAGVAMASPWFVHTSWLYLLLVAPFVFKMLLEFFKFYKSEGQQKWLSFFMWTNISMLVFLYVPVIDKWNFLFVGRN
jgi:heme o synthase